MKFILEETTYDDLYPGDLYVENKTLEQTAKYLEATNISVILKLKLSQVPESDSNVIKITIKKGIR